MSFATPSPVVPKIRFPEFQDAPAWKEKGIDALARVTQGGTPDTSNADFWGGPVNWMTPAEMGKEDSPYISSTRRTLTQEGLENCSSELLPPHSVIISTRAPIGHLAINTSPMAINQGCRGLIPFDDAHFLYNALLHAKARLLDLGAGNTFKELSGSVLKSFVLLVPAPHEQRKIAACLTSLSDLIAAESRKLEAQRQHKRGLMRQLFPLPGETVPRLRFPEFADAPEWETSTIGARCDSFSGGTPDTSKRAHYGGTIPFIRSAEIGATSTELHLTEEGLASSAAKMVKRGDVLVALYGANSGETALARITGAINQAILCLRSDDSAPFLYHYLTARKSWIIATYLQGGQGNLSGQIVLSVPLTIPLKDEQEQVAAYLSTVDKRIAAQKRWLEALKRHKQGLLRQLFPTPETP